MELTTQEQEALTALETKLEERDDFIHENLAIHWMSGEFSIDRNKAQELLQKYAIYTTDKHGNDAIVSISDNPSEERTFIEGKTDEAQTE